MFKIFKLFDFNLFSILIKIWIIVVFARAFQIFLLHNNNFQNSFSNLRNLICIKNLSFKLWKKFKQKKNKFFEINVIFDTIKLWSLRIVFQKSYTIHNFIFINLKIRKTSNYLKSNVLKLINMFIFKLVFIKFYFFKFQLFNFKRNNFNFYFFYSNFFSLTICWRN